MAPSNKLRKKETEIKDGREKGRKKEKYIRNKKYRVRFQVFAAPSMKITIFWDVAPCNLVEVY
jgi:hypothetical protein